MSDAKSLEIGTPPRKNVAPLAKEIKEVGIKDQSMPDTFKPGLLFDSPEAIARWEKYKPEIYAISAVIIDRIAQRTLTDRKNNPPFGLVTSRDYFDPYTPFVQFDQANPFQSLERAMNSTLIRANWKELRDLDEKLSDSSNNEPIKRAYQRLVDIIPARYPGAKNDEDKKGVLFFFINSGIQTATDTMSNMLKVIPEVHKRKIPDKNPSAEELARIATNSFPAIAELAMIHLKDLTGLTLDPDKFDLLEGKGSRLQILSPKNPAPQNSRPDLAFSGEQIGCPAMVNFGDGSAVKKLWDWHVDIARAAIYPRLVPSDI